MKKYLFLLIIFLSSFTYAGNKKALVIANQNNQFPHIVGAVHKGIRIADTLRKAGFEVSFYSNVSNHNFQMKTDRFALSLEKEDQVIFYFIGNQICYHGDSYLIGDFSEIKNMDSLEFMAVDFQKLKNYITDRSKEALFIMDTDNYNPFLRCGSYRSYCYFKTHSNEHSNKPDNYYVISSMQDGEQYNNDSPFTKILIEELLKPQSFKELVENVNARNIPDTKK